jgi:hypothetical protein
MDPSYRQIADLFGFEVPGTKIDPTLAGKITGQSAEESSALGGQSLSEGEYEKAISHFQRAIEQGGGASLLWAELTRPPKWRPKLCSNILKR